jgi:hypothetical protein
MANPNIVSVNSIYGNVTGYALTTTLTNVLLANATGSNKVYKIESIMVANITSAATNVTVQIHTAANGTAGTSYALANVISIPSSATLSVIDKNNTFYLMENQSIIGGASANTALQAVISYEDIS